ncbi:uncharacterized protein LOC141612970 [Silene latifolia]|uniref:uncharacterized protein LOC141612970 n=1 Tax=Silene latifolia TaxID=37657 RepID=UPI003D784927
MAKPFTRKDVRAAVFQLGPTKSPGPDGIPALFFQRYWFHVKNEVTEAVLSMLNSGTISPDINRTSITLIPKNNCPESVAHYRPISLCNVIMRIVTKCIANRLKPMMSGLVGEYQNGFIPGRSIADNILISHEIFSHISTKTKGKKGYMALKIDMSKAYDRLRWNFIRATLLTMGFPNNIVNLIMNCIQSVSYEVLINGSSGKVFKPGAGIRQGDPVSPYLFALSSEVLSRLIIDAEDKRLLHGIQICRNDPSISHLLFADDSIFFLDAKINYCQRLRDILDMYCQSSGQVINDNKSAVSFSPNCNLQTTRECIKTLKVSPSNSMGQYLGLPTDFGTTKKEIFSCLVEKVRKRILSWMNVHLSAAGRLTLIYSVLSSLSLYSLSAFRMPVSVISKIESLISQFWWGGCRVEKSIHWCSKLFLQCPKSMGGLGIRNVTCLNQSLLAKIGWTILQKPLSLIGRVLGPKIMISKETIRNMDLTKKGSFSWGVRSIRWGLELLREFLVWEVGFPSTLDVWTDNWIHGSSLAHLRNLSDHDLLSKPTVHVSSLQNSNGTWNMHMVTSICGQDSIPFIMAISIPCLDTADNLYWSLTKNGLFSVKSAYAICFSKHLANKATLKDRNRLSASSLVFCQKDLWSLPIHNKWKVFLWKILCNALPCGYEALKRNIQWNSSCVLCASGHLKVESLEHLFRDCNVAARVWFGSQLATTGTSYFCLPGRPLDYDGASLIIQHYPYLLVGSKLCMNHIRIKCDASWKSTYKAAAGWFFQDDVGQIFHYGSAPFWAKSAFQAEATALHFAISDAINHGFRHLDATSDCMNLVLQVNGFADINQEAKSIIKSISSLVLSCHCFSLSHCPRNLNRIAHTIAKSIV